MNIVALVCILAGTGVVESSVLPGARHEILGHVHDTKDTLGHIHASEVTLGHAHASENISENAHGTEDVSGYVVNTEEALSSESGKSGIADVGVVRDATLKNKTSDVNAEEDLQKAGLILNAEEDSANNAPEIASLEDLSTARTEEKKGVVDSQNEIKVPDVQEERIGGDEIELPENLTIISTTNSKKAKQQQSQVSFQGSFEDEPKDVPQAEDLRDSTIGNQSNGIIINADESVEQAQKTNISSVDDVTVQDSVNDSAASNPSLPSVSSSSPLAENSGDAKVVVRRLRRPLVKSRGTSRAVFASPMAAKNMMIMPYRFGFSVEDPTEGVYHTRTEEQPNEGPLVGSYSYLRADGVYMTVKYTAGADGYKATVYESAPPAGTRTVIPGTTRGAVSRPPGNVTGTSGGTSDIAASEAAGNGTKSADEEEGDDGTRTTGATGSPGQQQRPNSGVRSPSQIIRDAYREDIILREKQQQEQQQLQLHQLLQQQKQQQFHQLQHQYRQQHEQLQNQFRQQQQQQHLFSEGQSAEIPAYGSFPGTVHQHLPGIAPVSDINPQTIGQFPSTFSGVDSPDGTSSQTLSQLPPDISGVVSSDGTSSQIFGQFPTRFSGVASTDGTSSQTFGQFPAGYSGVASPDGTSSQTFGQFPPGFTGVASPDGTSSQTFGQFPSGYSGVASPDGTSSQTFSQFPPGYSGVASPDGTSSQTFSQFPPVLPGVASPDSTNSQTIGQFTPSFSGVTSSDSANSQPIGQFPQFFSGVSSPDSEKSQPISQFSLSYSEVASPESTRSQAIGQFPASVSGQAPLDGTSSQTIGQFPPVFSVVVPAGVNNPLTIGQFPSTLSGVKSPIIDTNPETISNLAPILQGETTANEFEHGINVGQEHQSFPELLPIVGQSPVFVIRQQAAGVQPPLLLTAIQGLPRPSSDSNPLLITLKPGQNQYTTDEFSPTISIIESNHQSSDATYYLERDQSAEKSEFPSEAERPSDQYYPSDNEQSFQLSDANNFGTSTTITSSGQSGVHNVVQPQNLVLGTASSSLPDLNRVQYRPIPARTVDRNRFPFPDSISAGNQFIPGSDIQYVDRQHPPTVENVNNEETIGKNTLPNLNSLDAIRGHEDIPQEIVPGVQSTPSIKIDQSIIYTSIPAVSGSGNSDKTNSNAAPLEQPFGQKLDEQHSPDQQSFGLTAQVQQKPEHQPFGQQSFGHQLPTQQLHIEVLPRQELFTNQLPEQQPLDQKSPEQQLLDQQPVEQQPLDQQSPEQQRLDQQSPEQWPLDIDQHSPGLETLFQESPDKQEEGEVSYGQQPSDIHPLDQILHVQVSSNQQQSVSSSFAGQVVSEQQSIDNKLPGQYHIVSQQSPDQQAFLEQPSNKQPPNNQLFGLESYSPEKQAPIIQQSIKEQPSAQELPIQESYDHNTKYQPFHTSFSPSLQSPNARFPGEQIFQQSSSHPSTGEQSKEFFTGLDVHKQSIGQILPNEETNQHFLVQKPISDSTHDPTQQQQISPSYESFKQSNDAIISSFGEVQPAPKPDGKTPPQSSIGDESTFGVSGHSTSTDEYELGVIERTKESSVQTTSIVGQPIGSSALNIRLSPNGQELSQSSILSVNGVQQNKFEGTPLSVNVPAKPSVAHPDVQEDFPYHSDEQGKLGQADQQPNLNLVDILQTNVTQQNTQQQFNIIPGVIATYGNLEEANLRNPFINIPQDDNHSGTVDSSNNAATPQSGKPLQRIENIIETWPPVHYQSASQFENSQAIGTGNVVLNAINRPGQHHPSAYPKDPYQEINVIPYFQTNVPAPIFPGTISGVRGGVQSNQVSGIASTYPEQIIDPLPYIAQDSKLPSNQAGEQLDTTNDQYNVSQGPTRLFFIAQNLHPGGVTNYLSTKHAVTQHTKNTHQYTFYPFAEGIFPVTSSESKPSTRVNDKRTEEAKPCSCEKNESEDLKDQLNLARQEHRFTFLQNAAAKLPFADQIYFRNMLNQIIKQSNRIQQFEQGYPDTAPIVWRVPTRINLDGPSSFPKPFDGSDSQINSEVMKPVFYTLPENELDLLESAGNKLEADSGRGDIQRVRVIAASNQEKNQQKVTDITPSQISAENYNSFSNIQTDVASSEVPDDSEKSPSYTIQNLDSLDDKVLKYFEDHDKINSGDETNLILSNVGNITTLNRKTSDSDQTTIGIESNQSDFPLAHPLEIPHLDTTSDNSLGKNPLDPTSFPFGILVSQSQTDSRLPRPIDDSINVDTAEGTQRSQLTQSSNGGTLFGGYGTVPDSNKSQNPVSFYLPPVPDRPRGYDYSPPAKQFDFAAQFRG